MACIKLGGVFPAATGFFFRRKLRSWHFVACIGLGEVFPAAARAVFVGKNGLPGILLHAIGFVRSSWLPQAPVFRQK